MFPVIRRHAAALLRGAGASPSESFLRFSQLALTQGQKRYISYLGTSQPRVTINTLRAMYKRSEPITMTTAYDFPNALVADGEVQIVLVGDSLSMVALGNSDTTQVDLENMIHHCRSVSQGTATSFVVSGSNFHSNFVFDFSLSERLQVCDLPMGSYEISPEQALGSASRLIKEGRAQSVKLEGGREMVPTISRICEAGIPVLGHVGLLPQRHNAFGGFKAQGKTCDSALNVLRDALAIQEAGCFAIVLEAIPGDIAAVITERLSVPTIGVGAGSGCSGQGIVQADVVGQLPGNALPRFSKRYGNVWATSKDAIRKFIEEVKTRQYPAHEHVYPVSTEVLRAFNKATEKFGRVTLAKKD